MPDETEFPDDLLQLQRDWYAADAAWSADPTLERRQAVVAAAGRLHEHPYWATVDNGHKARMALKQAALPEELRYVKGRR